MKLNFNTFFKIGISVFILYLCIYHWPSVFGLIKTGIGAAVPLIVGSIIAFVLNIRPLDKCLGCSKPQLHQKSL